MRVSEGMGEGREEGGPALKETTRRSMTPGVATVECGGAGDGKRGWD